MLLVPVAGHSGKATLFGFGSMLKHHWAGRAAPVSTTFCTVMSASSMMPSGLMDLSLLGLSNFMCRLEPE